MKEISITLNVSNERDEEFQELFKDCDIKDITINNSKFPVVKVEQKLIPSSIKDEYTTLKEKCIELECKRLGVKELKGYQMFILSAVAGFVSNIEFDPQRRRICKEIAIEDMKKHIVKVEKELNTPISNTESTYTYRVNDKDESVFKYVVGFDPINRKNSYTEKDIDRLKSILVETWMLMDGKSIKIGDCFKNWDFVDLIDGKVLINPLENLPSDGYAKYNDKTACWQYSLNKSEMPLTLTSDWKKINHHFINSPNNKFAICKEGVFEYMSKDEIFNKYQNILTKEQIKELYKN